jgi:hypothetical protein
MSYNVFNLLRDKILSYVGRNKKKQYKYQDEEKVYKPENEESTILLDETDKSLPLPRYNNSENKQTSVQLFNNTIIPSLYFLLGMVSIILMITLDYLFPGDSRDIYTEIGDHKTQVYNFFKLPFISPMLYLSISSIQCSIGCLMIYLVYSHFSLKYTLKGLKSISSCIKLHLLLFTGLPAIGLNYIYALCFNLPIYTVTLSKMFEAKLHTTLPEFTFGLHIYFVISFGVILVLCQYELQRNTGSECFKGDIVESSKPVGCYKIVLLIYTVLFTVMYILIKLYRAKIILADLQSDLLNSNSTFLYTLLPYLIYIFDTLFFLYLYDEIGNSNTVMTEDESPNNTYFDNKNMF